MGSFEVFGGDVTVPALTAQNVVVSGYRFRPVVPALLYGNTLDITGHDHILSGLALG
jgi:hypothetical protein